MPTPSSRRRKARVTSSRNRAANKPSTPKPVSTGSPRARAARARVATKPVTNSASRPSGGTAKVTSSASRDAGPSKADAKQWQKYQQSAKTSGTGQKGAPGTADAPKNATGSGARTPAGQIAANKLARKLKLSKQAASTAKTVKNVAKTGKAGMLGAVAASALQSRTADGTLKGKPTGPQKGPSTPKRLQQPGIDKLKFDDAFRQARTSGQKEFTWRGNRYTTKLK